KVSTIDAGYGLGEAVVSGLVTPDTYKVRDGQVVDKQVAAKELAVTAADDGGTTVREIEPERQNLPVLSDEQIVRLAQLGRKIELQFGCPQDIEWCLDGDEFAIVQSRPITTLYPIPAVDDGENHLYISVGHQQMMTDAIRLLSISVFQMVALRPMFAAGGRLFVDVANDLASPQMRNVLLRVMGPSEPLIGDALRTVLERGDFIKPLPEDEGEQLARAGGQVPLSDTFQSPTEDDPAIVSDLIQRSQMSIEEVRQAIATKTGTDLFDFIEEDIQRLKQELRDPQSSNAIRAGMGAASWINENMERWLGEKNVADTLTLSAPNNVTSEMGLALMDVADEIRPNAQVVDYLRTVEDDDFLDDLPTIEGGQESQDAIRAFLQRYGMRCAGEIDITRPRWRERPATLIPMILNNVDNFAPNAGQHRFEQGQREAARKEEELLGRLRQLPDGEQQAAETKRVISLLRHFIGYREYPKYSMMSRFFLYRQALLREAEALVEAGVVREPEDVYYLTFEEFRDAVRTHAVDAQLISNRKAEY
ncbi:MAG: phosphoenolpyruvate synthase, partial [Planctomycetes bacterium]|nr:phosphoenolpyruvate synthase [Planctomycetota bacterium]